MTATIPNLPRVVPDFSMINPKNIWLDIASGADIGAAISGGSGFSTGKRIFNLDPNGTYAGGNWISVSGGIGDICEIRPGGVTMPAYGTRIDRTAALGFNLPKITALNSTNAFRFDNVHGWRLRGLEIRGEPTGSYNGGHGDTQPLIVTCPDPLSGGYPSIPSHISIAQCRIGGDDANHHGTQNRKIAIMGCSTMLEIRDSTIFNINCGAPTYEGVTYVPQSQSTGAYAGMGKMLIDNCNLWGSTECIAFGGASQFPELRPEQQVFSDLTVRRCHIYRPDSVRGWQGCANNTEWKLGRRILVDSCIMENVYVELQNGKGVMFWTVDQNFLCPFTQACDATFRYCWFKNCAGVTANTHNYTGGGAGMGIDACRFRMEHCFSTGGGVTGSWRTFEPDDQFADLSLDHCMFINVQGDNWSVCNPAPHKRLSITNCILGTTYSGSTLFFTSSGTGQIAWDIMNTNGDCDFYGNHNLALSGSGTPNPGTNTTHTSYSTMGFVNSAYVGSMDTFYADLGNLVNTTGAGPDFATTIPAKLAGVQMTAAEYGQYATMLRDGRRDDGIPDPLPAWPVGAPPPPPAPRPAGWYPGRELEPAPMSI